MIYANNINYEIVELLFDNKHSRLYKCKHDKKYYMIKCYREKYKQSWSKEINVFSDIKDYSNIIQYIGSCSDVRIYNNKYHLIIMEFAKYGDLFKYLEDNEGFIYKEEIINIFLQIINGLKHLKKNNWVHRDLKPENIVITNIDPINVKIIDFQFATNEKFSSRSVGTLSYMSPQVLQNLYYDTHKNDIWCLGVMLFSMYTYNRPYSVPNKLDDANYYCDWLMAIKDKNWKRYWLSMERILKSNKINTSLLVNGNLPIEFKDIIQKMLSWDQKNRCTLKEVLVHPFFKNNESPVCCMIL